jgi:hypothetical protein
MGFSAGLLSLLAPLVLLLGLHGFAALRECIIHALAFLAIEDGPHCLLAGRKLGGDIKQLVGVDRWASPKLAHEVSYARELGTALGKRLMKSRSDSPGIWVHARSS